MRDGFAIIVGKVVDITAENFTGKDGSDIRKSTALIKTGEEASPIEIEIWAETADKFEGESPVGGTVVARCGVVGRSWQKDGKTFRRTAIRLRDWSFIDRETVTTTPPTGTEDVPF